jgi:ribosomal protein S18 acetylase RimI-like enzyme
MADGELPAHIAQSRAEYAEGIELDAGMPAAEAQAKAARDVESLFPGGRPSKGQHVFALEDAESGERVGRLHYAERPLGSRRAWLYDVAIDAPLRGKGLGREAMLAFERHLRERGYTRTELNVFGGNERARSLYRSLGYRELGITMGKDLDG